MLEDNWGTRLSHDQLTYDDLLRIVELIKTSEQFSEFRLKIGEIEVELRRHDAAIPQSTSTASAAPPPATPAEARTDKSATSSPAVDAQRAAPAVQWPDHFIVIRSPMVGTFYRAPEPGARPFVELGDTVDEHSTVCIVEVMKLMNSIPAGARGIVRHILVDDGEPVEAQQPIIVVEPSA